MPSLSLFTAPRGYARFTGPNLLNGPMSKQKLDRVRASVEFITQRLSLIRAIYIVSVSSNGPPEEVHREFHQAVGDIMEGMALPKLNLTYIDKQKVSAEVSWLRERV